MNVFLKLMQWLVFTCEARFRIVVAGRRHGDLAGWPGMWLRPTDRPSAWPGKC